MVDSIDTFIAHIMVGCPKIKDGSDWVPVLGVCKPCEYCVGFVIDPHKGIITGVRCNYFKSKKT